jgi:hypothetical protein
MPNGPVFVSPESPKRKKCGAEKIFMKKSCLLYTVVHTCNPSTWGAKTGELLV